MLFADKRALQTNLKLDVRRQCSLSRHMAGDTKKEPPEKEIRKSDRKKMDSIRVARAFQLLEIREKELNFYVRAAAQPPRTLSRLPNAAHTGPLAISARRRRIASRSARSRRCSLASPTPASRRWPSRTRRRT